MDLQCPDPEHCPVVSVDALPATRTVVLPASTWWRCYESTFGYDEFNPRSGDTRFAPFPGSGGKPVPTIYAAGTGQAALLETVFHSVHQSATRLVYESPLRRSNLCHARIPRVASVVDLRDSALELLGIGRAQIVSSSAEHYPCTRRIAHALHRRHRKARGIVWHSRQAELTGNGQVETLLLFGDRYPVARGGWTLQGKGSFSLLTGEGRLFVDELASSLDATVVPTH